MYIKFNRILSCLFGRRRKVQVTSFAFEDFILVVGSSAHSANSVGTLLEFAAFDSGPDAKYSRASAFCFFLSIHNHAFCGGPNTFSPENTSVFMSIGICRGVVVFVPSCYAGGPGSVPSEHPFFFFSFVFFNLTT